MSINRVCISGNLTRDMELRSTAGGTSVGSFCVAVNERRKNASTGEWEDFPCFVDCALFGKRAEALERYLAKGAKVAVEGRLRYSSWERDGQRRSKLEVVVDEVEFLAPREKAQGAAPRAPQAALAAGSVDAQYDAIPAAIYPDAVYGEDIPF